MTTDPSKRILAIVGPTGTGKSDIAMALAMAFNGEIISCDSVQVYRHFDIGSAKPTGDDRRRVVHHLVDVADWSQPFDAAVFRRLAEAAVADVQSRGRLPILCGGTGLYMRALRYGLVSAPPSDPRLRAQLLASEQEHPGSLHARLAGLDPVGAARVHPQNLPHVMRALELCIQTRQPASALRSEHGFRVERMPMMVCWLDRDTHSLRTRIAQRTQAMLDAGWVTEVQHLLSEGVSPECRPMRSVGYRDIVAHLQQPQTVFDLRDKIIAGTWQYARRQRTWWRREKDVLKFDMDHNDYVVPRIAALWRGAANMS